MSNILEQIKLHTLIDKDLVDIEDVKKIGTCYYKTISLCFTKDESYFNFFAGNLEIIVTTRLFKLNIAMYENQTDGGYYKKYSLFTPQYLSKEFILINNEERGHYNLMHLKKLKTDNSKYE